MISPPCPPPQIYKHYLPLRLKFVFKSTGLKLGLEKDMEGKESLFFVKTNRHSLLKRTKTSILLPFGTQKVGGWSPELPTPSPCGMSYSY